MKPVAEFQITRRNLPHWQSPGAVYFITWRAAKTRILDESDRTTALNAILFWHTKRWFVYAAVVMPDHVHILARALPLKGDDVRASSVFDLSGIIGGVKKFSARVVNESKSLTGSLWQDEWYDRIQRDDREMEESWTYVRNNPVKAGLVDRPEEYLWLFETKANE